jgi:hypothetical protein
MNYFIKSKNSKLTHYRVTKSHNWTSISLKSVSLSTFLLICSFKNPITFYPPNYYPTITQSIHFPPLFPPKTSSPHTVASPKTVIELPGSLLAFTLPITDALTLPPPIAVRYASFTITTPNRIVALVWALAFKFSIEPWLASRMLFEVASM